MKSPFFNTLFIFLALTGCYPSSTGNDAATLSSVSRREALPLNGTFKATQVWASSEDGFGARTAVHAKAEDLNTPLWRVRLSIDSEGSGMIQGLVKCTGPAPTTGSPSRIKPHQVLNLMFGALGMANLIRQTLDDVQCARSADGAIASLLAVNPSRNFIGNLQESLPKNLGVFGEVKSLQAADNECRKMRGFRYINVQQSSACVGFTDASANRVRFLILPPAEIYVVRVDMVRD
ncbi:MAG: hypothetical protein EBR09_13025 [Proteobacteria bacterium]|nr:hypothetical protein [Pseudomonadota bacterium]